ncbi:hypothetical protein [Dactylosporangium darangshiense]|uniref:hypothetical protein n=1 Tax=Dactylosporangium darangshiense TaxID=579108 RepID=UPI0031ED7949
MGKHNSRSRADGAATAVGALVLDPDARATRVLLSRWCLAFALSGLVLWPAAPLSAVALTLLLFGLGTGARSLAPMVLAPRCGIAIVPDAALPAWREAEQADRRIRAAWPALGAMAEPADIGPALDRARYRLAVLLYRRAELDRSLHELRAAIDGLAADAPLRAEVHERGAEFATRRAELSERIAERIGALRRLAELSGEHAHAAERAERARGALRRAQRAAAGPEPDADAVGELAERTTAVLGAYRELSALPPPP